MRPKRLISLLVAVCMMITMLPLSAVTAFAADTAPSTGTATVDGYKYAYTVNAENGTATITKFLGPVDPANNGPYDIEIPTELDHHPVTGLGEYSFSGIYSSDHQKDSTLLSFCNQIQSVTIPESVTSIGKSAFEHCSKLDSLTIKGVATSIGACAFASCTSLTSLSLVGNFQTIGEQAFAYCGMTSLTTDADITSIGEYAFSHCTSLTSLSLTGSVQTIGYQAFACCTSLTSLSLTGDIQKIGDYAFGYCSSLYTATLSKNLTSIGTYAFEYCTSLNSIEIPGKVTEIGDYAFIDAGLTSVTIDEGVKSTGAYMFYKCGNLTTVTLPESLTTIADGSFAFCSNLDHVKIPARVTCIGDGAFSNCTSLSDITLQDGVKTIGADAFLSCEALTSITLPDSVTDIGKEAFYYCDELASITIPENVTAIKPDTFYWCFSLKDITLPAGLTSFQDELTRCPAGRFYATDYKKDENGQPITDKDGNPIYIYTPNGAIYYNNYKTTADALLASNDVLAERNFLYLCKVTFDANGGNLTGYDEVPVYKTEKITKTKANDLTENDLNAINAPTRTGYNFTGWYTTPDGKPEDGKFDVNNTAITEDITLYAGWEPDPNAPVCHTLTLKDGVITSVTVPGKDGADPEDITEIVKKNANEDGSFNVPEGATVSVAFDKDAFADSGLKFGHWDINGLDDPNAYQDKESFDFVMPAKGVTLKAMTQDASIEDDEPDIVGPIVIGTTVVVGGAVLGYQAYSLGAEFAGKLMALPYFPSNRSALAMMLWEDAGKPMPESELLYPDVGQEERDMDLQHAARWAMENELIPDLNDEGTAPEEMKFYPDNAVSKLDVLNAWQKAQELKNN